MPRVSAYCSPQRRAFLLVLPYLLLSACANPSIESVNADAITRTSAKKILVARFEGNPNFVDEATDLFVSELSSKVSLNVAQGGPLRSEGADIASGTNLASPELAVAAGQKAGAGIVIIGKVTSHSTGGLLNGFSTVRMYDVASGATLASFHRPSGLLVGNSEHQAVLAAVKRTAKDVATALRSAD